MRVRNTQPWRIGMPCTLLIWTPVLHLPVLHTTGGYGPWLRGPCVCIVGPEGWLHVHCQPVSREDFRACVSVPQRGVRI